MKSTTTIKTMYWISGCILLFSLFLTVSAEASPHVTLELLVEDGSRETNSSWSTTTSMAKMPSKLVFRIRRDHEVAVLRLTKIPVLKTIACREGGSVPLTHISEDKASYADYSTKAVLLITRSPASQAKYTLEGHFQIGLRLVHIEPTSDGVHEIIRQETLLQRFQDMSDEHIAHHRYKRSLRTYTIETCLIADYQAFANFLERNNNDVAKAEADMRNYYAFIAEQMKVRFHHINEVEGTIEFNIVYSGLIIIETRTDSSFSEPFKTGDLVEVDAALNATQFWLDSPPSGIVLPPSDHYMFFTGYNLVNNGNTGNAGKAYTAVMCIASSFVFPGTNNVRLKGSTSIVEDKQGASTARTAAHEMGHALSASHDSNVGCNDDDQYIMATSSSPISNSTLARHPWQFSTCSVNEIKTFVERADVDCLNDNRYGDGVVTSTEKAGQYFDKDAQCKMLKGEDSRFCNGLYQTNTDQMCYLGYCLTETFPDGRSSCGTVDLMEYSTCDTDKWCYKGLCINADNSAPIFVNVPTSAVQVASNTQGNIYTVQTFDADGDTLTVHITYDPSNVSTYLIFDTTTKRFSVRPGFNLANLQISNFSLIMSVDDGLLLSLPVNVDFQITAPITNQPPSFTENSYNFTVNEGKFGEVVVPSLLNSVTDPDANTQFLFILRLVTTNSDYFRIDSSSGQITYAKNYDYDPVRLPNNVQLSVEVRDQTGFSDTTTIFLTILNVDQPPVFQNLPATVKLPENTAAGTLIFDVSATDSDSTDTIGFFFPTTNGVISTYLDLDPNTGRITMKPGYNINYEQLTAITFQVSIRASTVQAIRDATLTITITNVNEPPTFTRSSYGVTTTTGPKDQVIVQSLTGVASDPDFGDRIVNFGIEPGQYVYLFNIDSTNGRITFSQEYGTDRSVYPSQVALVVTATDTSGLKGTAVYTITVNIGNRKPTLTNLPSTKSVSENTAGGTSIFQVFAQDPDGDAITFVLQSTIPVNQNQFSLSSAGEVSVRSGALIDFESLPELMYLTIAAFDGKASSTAANLTLVITNVNEQPSFTTSSITFTVNEGRVGDPLVPSLLPYITDPDSGESFNFAITQFNLASYFFINEINGAISYNKNYDTDPTRLPSTVQLAVTATDSGGNRAGITIVLEIQNVNQSPVFTNLPERIAVSTATVSDGSVIFNVGVVDADTQDTLTIASTFLPSDASRFFSYRSIDRAVLFTGSSITSNTTFSIRFTVSDGQSTISDILTIDVTVPTPTTTQAPTTTLAPLEITNLPATTFLTENTKGPFYTLSFNRADRSSLTYQLVQTDASLPRLFEISSGGAVSVITGAIIDYETLPNRIMLSITATEGAVTSNPKTLTVVTLNVNERPRFNQSEYNFTVDEGQKDKILISSLLPYVTDEDAGDSLTFSILTSQYSKYFDIDQSSGRLTYAADYDTDPNGLLNVVAFRVQVTDTGGAVDIADIRFNIRNINQQPEFTNLPASRTIGTTLTSGIFFTVSATDKDSADGLTVSMESSAYFSFDQNGNTVRFLGRQSLASTQNFQLTFTVTDGQLSSSAILTITVVVEEPTTTTTIRPLIFTNLPRTITIPENSATNPVFTVTTNEPDLSKLTFQMKSTPAGFQINSDGAVSLLPGLILDYERFPSGFSLQITCSDGQVTSSPVILTISVQDLNEPPQFSQEQYNITASEGTRGKILVSSLTSSVTDPDANEQFSFSILPSQNSQYFNINQANGRISLASDYDADPKRLPFDVTLTVRVLDKGNVAATSRIQFRFTNINQPPSFTNLPSTRIIEPSFSTGVIFTVQSTDPDTADTLVLTIDSVNPSAYANLFSLGPGGQLTFTRNEGEVGNQTIALTFIVNDGLTTRSSSTLTIRVYSSPETTTAPPPTTTARPLRLTNLPTTINVDENSINGVFVVTTDAPSSDGLMFSLSSPDFSISDDGTVSVKTGVILDYEKSPRVYQLQISATNYGVTSPEETLTIQIRNVNEPPKFNTTSLYFTTNEGKAGDPVVDSLLPFVRDEDVGETFTFEFLPRGTYKDFTMDPATGGFIFAKEHDVFNGRYDRLGLNVKVTDSGQLSAEAYIQLTIEFVNQAPKFAKLPQTLTIPSTTSDGQTIFTVQAVDTDMFDTITVDVNVQTPEAAQFFDLNNMGKEVNVTFKNGENILSDRTFTIEFIATDGRFTVNSTLTITVNYVPRETTELPSTTTARPLKLTNLPTTINVDENSINGVFVVTTDAPSSDGLMFSLSSPYFSISNDGTVSVKTGVILDYEKSPRVYQLQISATNYGVTSPEETLTIQIRNVNEPPKFNTTFLYFTANEGKAGDPVVESFLPFVRDEDVGETFTFEILPSGLYKRFTMDPATGGITFAKEFDVMNGRYDRLGLDIKVTDSGQLSAEAYIQLTIDFVSQAPKFAKLPQSLTIPSTTSDGQTIFTVQAVDTDMFDTITVDVNVRTPEASQFFDFNKMGKEVNVTFKNGENILSDRTFTIEFIATDGRFTVNSTLTITVYYVPRATTSTQATTTTESATTTTTEQATTTTQQPPAPAFNQSRYSFTVTDGENGEIVIPSLRPFMMDSNQNRDYKFSIIPAAYSSAFNINASSGEITFATNYDLTQLPNNVNLQILVQDSSNSVQSTTAVVNLVIVPKNNAPEFQNIPRNVTISGSSAPGTGVFTVVVIDKDTNDVLEITMRHISSVSESLFTYDALTKAVKVAPNAVFSSSKTYILELTVTDGKDRASANLTIFVNVDPVTTTKPTEQPTTTPTERPTDQTTPVTSTEKPTTKSAVTNDSDSLLNEPWAISAIIIVVVLVPVVIVIVLFMVCRKTKTKDGSTEKIYDTRSTGTRSLPISYYPKYSYKSEGSRTSAVTKASGIKPYHYPFSYFKQSSVRSKVSTKSS